MTPVAGAQLSSRLHALAQHELTVPGRYRLGTVVTAPEEDPLWLRALRWLYERWQDVWQALFGHTHVPPSAIERGGDVALVLLGIGLLAVAIQLARNVVRARSRSRLAAQPLELPPDPQSLYRAACEAAVAGSYGRAALLLFAATVALLDAGESPATNASATVRELRGRLRARDASLVVPFDAVAAPFVETLFAQRSVAAQQWDRAREAFLSLQNAIGA